MLKSYVPLYSHGKWKNMLTISGEFLVFLITPFFNLIFIMNSILVFFLIGLIYDVLFSCLYSIPVCSEGNIVDHIFAKHNLAWCCLRCCVIGASNSLVIMQLIEGSNHTDYLCFLLDFHYCFPSQMI
jgi:hypothetical protein